MTYPADFRYTKDHEWIKVEGGVGTIGLTDHAQHELGDIVLVDLPKVGTSLAAQQTLGTVESVKAVSEIFSPVSGEVTEVNEAVGSAPEKVNQDPHGDGWLLKLRLANPAEVDGLMNADQYTDYIQQKAG
ncbi:MAG: glycine cleavage system protein GcvH [Acidobacteriota bacterium]